MPEAADTSRLGVLKRIELYLETCERQSLSGLDLSAAIDHISMLANLAGSLRHAPGLLRAIGFAEELLGQDQTPETAVKLHLMAASAWERIRLINEAEGAAEQWERPELERQLAHLCRAFDMEGIRRMGKSELSAMLSSISSLLTGVGRFSEAVEYADKAVAVGPDNAYARARRGYALTHYAQTLYDKHETRLFLGRAKTDMKKAADSGSLDAGMEHHINERLRWIDERFPDIRDEDFMFSPPAGATEEEAHYRHWCLRHRLFLNPLNDLGPLPAAARDTLMAPSTVLNAAGRNAYHQGYYNQIKQSFVSARFLFYEGVRSSEERHYSDKDVLLFDTLDYPTYSLASEKVRAAFCIAHSIMDKCADLLSRHLGLGIPTGKADFRTFWYDSTGPGARPRPEFLERANWPMRGLFWLSKDFYADAEGLKDTIEPNARELHDIRVRLEKSYLKLHEPRPRGMRTDTVSAPADAMAMSILKNDFEARTLRLLKSARAAVFYLTFALHIEQKRRRRELAANGPIRQLILDSME